MKSIRYSILPILAGAGFLGSGCGPSNQFQPPPPPQVTVAPPEIRDITIFQSFPGHLEAVEQVEIRARVRGYLEQVAFDDGARVEKDQVLFIIEQAPYEAALKSAEAKLAQAHASQSLAESALERKKRAFANQAVSELDVLSAEADLEAAGAAVQAGEAAVQQAQLDLSYATITAPISGRIARHYVSEGNLVGGADATLLTLLVSEDPVYCYFNMDERSLMRLQKAVEEKGETTSPPVSRIPPVRLELADGSVYGETGVVDFVDTTVDASTGTLTLRARFPNPGNTLVAGMFGKVLFPVSLPGAMLVPELSVQRDMVGAYVLTVDGEGTVESAYVELGPRYEDLRVIRSGLDATAPVIVKGLQRARPGIKVQTGSGAKGEGN